MLAFTDVMLAGGAPGPHQADELRRHYTQEQIVELGLGVALFHGLSKMLIVLGVEPDEMDTTVMPTPDLRR